MAFNLHAAKAGIPVKTESGTKVKFVAHLPQANPECRVVVLINGDVEVYAEDGKYLRDKPSKMDLTT